MHGRTRAVWSCDSAAGSAWGKRVSAGRRRSTGARTARAGVGREIEGMRASGHVEILPRDPGCNLNALTVLSLT